MKTIRYRSGMPYLLCGLVVLLYAFIFGLGSLLGYAGALLLAYLAYAPIARLFPDRYVVVEDIPDSKYQPANALIQECAAHMRALRAAGDIIYDPWLLEKVDIIAIGYRGLLRALSENPALLGSLGPYLRYLLPNTVMLLNVRVKLQDRQLDADKVNTRRRIDESLIAVEQSLEKQLSLLERHEPLQVEEDVLQMKNLLGQSGILQPDAVVAVPEQSPDALIAEELDTRRQALLQVLRDRVAAMLEAPLDETEEPSVYAASMAAPAPAFVVPVAPEPAEAAQVASMPVAPAPLQEDEDYQAARKRLIAILEESVQKLEEKAKQEQLETQDAAETFPSPEPEGLDRLIADAQAAFLTEGTQEEEQRWNQPPAETTGEWEEADAQAEAEPAPEAGAEGGSPQEIEDAVWAFSQPAAATAFSIASEETRDVERDEDIPDDSTAQVEEPEDNQTEFGSIVDDLVISEAFPATAFVASAFQEDAAPAQEDAETEAELEAPPVEALPQAGDWFSMEGFEDEDDVPVYHLAKPVSWVAPPTSPKAAPVREEEAAETVDAEAQSPVFTPEGTDVPSVMDIPEEPAPSAWMDAPAMEEPMPAPVLRQAMQHAMAAVQKELQAGQTDHLSGRDYLAEIGKQFSVAMEQSRVAQLSGEPQGEAVSLFQAPALPVQRTQRGRMTSRQIEEMVLGDILRNQGMQDAQRQEPNQEMTGRKRKPRMEIDRSVLMALLGHDGTESPYLQ